MAPTLLGMGPEVEGHTGDFGCNIDQEKEGTMGKSGITNLVT